MKSFSYKKKFNIYICNINKHQEKFENPLIKDLFESIHIFCMTSLSWFNLAIVAQMSDVAHGPIV